MRKAVKSSIYFLTGRRWRNGGGRGGCWKWDGWELQNRKHQGSVRAAADGIAGNASGPQLAARTRSRTKTAARMSTFTQRDGQASITRGAPLPGKLAGICCGEALDCFLFKLSLFSLGDSLSLPLSLTPSLTLSLSLYKGEWRPSWAKLRCSWQAARYATCYAASMLMLIRWSGKQRIGAECSAMVTISERIKPAFAFVLLKSDESWSSAGWLRIQWNSEKRKSLKNCFKIQGPIRVENFHIKIVTSDRFLSVESRWETKKRKAKTVAFPIDTDALQTVVTRSWYVTRFLHCRLLAAVVGTDTQQRRGFVTHTRRSKTPEVLNGSFSSLICSMIKQGITSD